MDRIGEVIGPKGKVINALQQETGADIAVDDDGMVGTVTIGAKDGTAVEEARRRICHHPRSAAGRGGRHLPGQGGQHHQVRCLRQHPPRPGRPAAHLQDRAGQASRPGRGRARARAAGRGEGGRHRSAGQGVALAGRRAPATGGTGGPSRPPTTPGAVGAGADGRRDHADRRCRCRRSAVLLGTAPGPLRSRTCSRRSWPRSSAISDPTVVESAPGSRRVEAEVGMAEAAGAVADAVEHARPPRGRRGSRRSGDPDRGAVLRPLPRDRAMDDARSVCIGFWVGTGARDEEATRGRRVPLSRAPAVQGHRGTLRVRHRRGGGRGRRRLQRLHHQGVHVLLHPAAGRAPRRWAWTSSATSCGSPPSGRRDLEAERQVILDEILMHADEPADQAAEQSSALAVPASPPGSGGAGQPRNRSAT